MTIQDEVLSYATLLERVRTELAEILTLLERARHGRRVGDRAAEADEAEARLRLTALVKELTEARLAGHG